MNYKFGRLRCTDVELKLCIQSAVERIRTRLVGRIIWNNKFKMNEKMVSFSSDKSERAKRHFWPKRFFKKLANPGLFIHLFSVFSNKHHYKFYNKLLSIQYTVPGFEPTTFGTRVSSHDHYTRAPAQKIDLLDNYSYTRC